MAGVERRVVCCLIRLPACLPTPKLTKPPCGPLTNLCIPWRRIGEKSKTLPYAFKALFPGEFAVYYWSPGVAFCSRALVA